MIVEESDMMRDPAIASWLDRIVPFDPDRALKIGEQLRREIPPHHAAWVMTQARLRTKAAQRFGTSGADLWWTPDGLEQATRPQLAERHAQILSDAGASVVADLGCGVGLDTLAFAKAGLRVVAVERDPTTAEVARANTEVRGVAGSVTVVTADATTVDVKDHGCDAVFLDPARRRAGRRLFDPEQWSPPLSHALAVAGSVPCAVLKVAPGLDRNLRPQNATFEAVSIDGSMVEATLRMGSAAASDPFAAVMLPGPLMMTGAGEAAIAVAPFGQWLIEADDAIIRAGLLSSLAAELDARLVDANVAYLTAEHVDADRRYARFEIDEVLPFSVKTLRAALRARDVGRVEIKKRAFAADPEKVRRDLKLRGSQERVVLLTRVGDQPIAVIAWRR